jgi:hypothetical protein
MKFVLASYGTRGDVEPCAALGRELRDEFRIYSGSLHHIENICTNTAEFIITFRNELPEDFGLNAAFGAMTDGVLRNIYVLPGCPRDELLHHAMHRHRQTATQSLRQTKGKAQRSSDQGAIIAPYVRPW